MNVLDIATFACRTVGDVSDETLDFAKSAIRLKYQTIYDAHLWRESLRTVDGLLLDPSLGGVFFLPSDAEEVIYLSLSYDGTYYRRLAYRERDWVERFATNQVSVRGYMPTYAKGENMAWPYFNPGHFYFYSEDTDVFTLFISGYQDDVVPVNETFVMQALVNPDGTINPAQVYSAYSYSKVTAITKGITNNPLNITAEFPVAPNQMDVLIPAGTSELTFTQIILTPPPLSLNSDGSNRDVFIRGQFKLKVDPLDSDYSVPRLSHITDALVEFTLTALYKKGRQLSKADNCEQKGIAHIQAAVNVEKNQSETRQQAVPIIYDRGDYLSENYGRGHATSSFPWGWSWGW